jgi:FMN phosphatase YigB (HAD superfamily)
LANVKGVLFDLHGTVAYCKDRATDTEISGYLFSRGYEVSSQQLRAAWSFVSFIDYPKYGYRTWGRFFARIFWRLKVEVDKDTLNVIARLLESTPYHLYPDAAEAIVEAKKYGFKTAIVTTIARFQFEERFSRLANLGFCHDGLRSGMR